MGKVKPALAERLDLPPVLPPFGTGLLLGLAPLPLLVDLLPFFLRALSLVEIDLLLMIDSMRDMGETKLSRIGGFNPPAHLSDFVTFSSNNFDYFSDWNTLCAA